MKPVKVRRDKLICHLCEGEYDPVYCPDGICPGCNQILHESENIFDAIGKIMKRKLRNM